MQQGRGISSAHQAYCLSAAIKETALVCYPEEGGAHQDDRLARGPYRATWLNDIRQRGIALTGRIEKKRVRLHLGGLGRRFWGSFFTG
jgi:hypothetical protein